ncbi:MAG: hypothetical protein NZ822_01115 [Patescibacteria group bacterium]|nr:hypothetical protein [Patescibacteria group bacterium]
MLRINIINLSLILSILFLSVCIVWFVYSFYQNIDYSYAQSGGSCLYLKWDRLPGAGVIPQSVFGSSTVVASPIKIFNGNVVVENSSMQVDGTLTTTRLCLGVNCRSDWPGAVGEAVSYWLLKSTNTGAGGQIITYLHPSSTQWRVGIGSTTIPTTTLEVFGNVKAQNFLGTINAINISAGTFASSTGGGNFTFPAGLEVVGTSSVGALYAKSLILVGTTSPLTGIAYDERGGIKVNGTIQARRLCVDDVCLNNFKIYSISTKYPFTNGLYYRAITGWRSVFPVTNIDLIEGRDNSPYQYPYISFYRVLTNSNIQRTSTSTEWFDLFYSHHNINESGFDKAIYLEGSGNFAPLGVYFRPLSITTTCGGMLRLARQNCDDYFLSGSFYDGARVLRSTTSEKFIVEKCFNDDPNDGCLRPGESWANFLDRSAPVKGRVFFDFRVVPWQRPTTSYVCSEIEYIPRLRTSIWNHPADVFFMMGKYKFVTSTGHPCDTANLRSKIQGRFYVEEIKRIMIWNPDGTEVETTIGPSSLGDILSYIGQDRINRDIVLVIKDIGIALLAIVNNQ